MSHSPNPVTAQQVAPLLVLATEFLKAGRPADAIAPLRDAALLDPFNCFIQHDLGLACLEVGRVADAISALRRAVASDPRYGDAHFRLGIALEKQGDLRAAIVAYDRATLIWTTRTRSVCNHPLPPDRGEGFFVHASKRKAPTRHNVPPPRELCCQVGWSRTVRILGKRTTHFSIPAFCLRH